MATNRMGPPCPECGSLTTDVNRTARSKEGHFWRRRDCPICGHHFQTIQHSEVVVPPGAVSWDYRKVRVHWSYLREYFASLLAA